MKIDLAKAFVRCLRENIRWWLVPTIVMVIVLAILLFLSEGPSVAPFLYRR